MDLTTKISALSNVQHILKELTDDIEITDIDVNIREKVLNPAQRRYL